MDKQIEEMAGIIGQAIDHNSFLGDERIAEIDMQGIAKELLNHYQPKIPDGAVVLTKEEWESRAYVRAMENDLCKKCRERIGEEFAQIQSNSFDAGIKHGSKETAEKILNEIMSTKTEDKDWRKNESFVRFVDKVLDKCEELAKQFGVRI